MSELLRRRELEVSPESLEEDLCDEILDLLDALPENPYKRNLIDLLESESYGSMTNLQNIKKEVQEKLKKLKEIKRNKFATGSFAIEKLTEYVENAEEISEDFALHLEKISSQTENLLGEGRTARVFESSNHPNICYKIIYNHNYLKLGDNTVQEEFDFMQKLSDLEVDGVSIPKPFFVAGSEQFQAIVMERIPGITLESIFRGDARLPDDFNIEVFIDRLRKYVDIMHQRGVYHRDLGPQNVMYAIDSGRIALIDFGRSAQRKFAEQDMYREEGISLKAGKRYLDDDKMIVSMREKLYELKQRQSIDI